MILRQFLHTDPTIALSYLLGCGSRAAGAVIDPVETPRFYVSEAEAGLAVLPDHVEVLPGAFSGSVCGRGLSGKPTSTIGFERRHNRAFRVAERDDFVALMLRDVPPRPPEAERVRRENLGHVDAPAEAAAS